MSKIIFNVGTVVVLKSRIGPRMTVAENFENGTLRAQWFDTDDKLHDGFFDNSSLQRSE